MGCSYFFIVSISSNIFKKMSEQEEIWKDIEGYEGLYQVSNMGRVKSFKWNKDGRIMKIKKDRHGYHEISLCINNIPKFWRTHRLVALTFLPNTENKRTVNHIDGNKLNNRLENLEWTTHGENISHAYRTGLNEARTGLKNTQFKGIIQGFDKEEKLFVEFRGKKDIINQGYIPTAVYGCVNGRIKTYRGLIFKRIPNMVNLGTPPNLPISG